VYRISGHDEESLVLSYLDLREREYDIRTYLDFFTMECSITPAISNVLVYIGSQNRAMNRFYLGPAPLEDMASQIAKAVGPAGPNYEYLFWLEEALGEIGCVDEDLSELAKEVRRLLEALNGHTFVLKHLQNGLCNTSQV
jgi:cation transport regulator ChaC